MNWIDTATGETSALHQEAFWERLRSDLRDGTFWADRIGALRNQPAERLKLAVENLPLPAAFREAAVAVRAMVRDCMKRGDAFTTELGLLYWLAAVESFGVPYSEVLRQPGFNVLQSIPGDVIKGLPFTYAQLGYEHLGLLTKTDIKWLVGAWGEPLEHSTLNRLHNSTWRSFELQEKARQDSGERPPR
ncbi:hypothetical protein ABIC83_002721 [Roseateles asaccharophilus]|uniref:hypothetical protein n=1 Tax=Roseateles asaccharophilus TaxID=582607 RepID=UPI0038347CE0